MVLCLGAILIEVSLAIECWGIVDGVKREREREIGLRV